MAGEESSVTKTQKNSRGGKKANYEKERKEKVNKTRQREWHGKNARKKIKWLENKVN